MSATEGTGSLASTPRVVSTELAAGRRLALVGGGTGGHLIPGLHFLAGLTRRGVAPADLLWFVSGRAIERRVFDEPRVAALCQALGGERVVLGLEGRRGGAPGRVELMWRSAPAVVRARTALKRHGSEVLLGLGGYTSLPAVLAARSLGIPIALFEINAVPGAATRSLARFATRVLCAFPEAARSFGERGRVVGAPLDAGFAERPTEEERRAARVSLGYSVDRPLLVVLGGSQGARALNRFVKERGADLARRGVQVLHQCGPGRRDEGAPHGLAPSIRSVEYLDDVEIALRAATVALTRGGASTLAEIAGLAVPAVIVPLPSAADDHQRANARALGEGAWTLEETELAMDGGRAALETLVHLSGPGGAGRRAELSNALAARPRDGVERLAAELASLVREYGSAPGAHAELATVGAERPAADA